MTKDDLTSAGEKFALELFDKAIKNAMRKAAICGLITMNERSRFCLSRIKL
jgi:hypothetical protein